MADMHYAGGKTHERCRAVRCVGDTWPDSALSRSDPHHVGPTSKGFRRVEKTLRDFDTKCVETFKYLFSFSAVSACSRPARPSRGLSPLEAHGFRPCMRPATPSG